MSVALDIAPILIVDDNAGDINLVQEALAETGPGIEVRRAYDGESALMHLRRVVSGIEPAPSLVLLDINMPGMTGFDVLRFVRGEHAFDEVPVFMISTSRRPADLALAEELGATGYIGKPEKYDEYLELARRLME